MTTRYPIYKMTDGQTRLAESYFNPILREIDSRLDVLERLQVSWEAAVAELSGYGIERLDAIIVPLADNMQAQVDAISDSWSALSAQIDAGLSELNGILGDVEALVEEHEVGFVAYADRAQMRTTEPTAGAPTIVEGLGLFAWAAGSDEPDDDETCFATENGCWLLQAPSFDLVAQVMMTEIAAA